jgi:hypothetical protein
VTAPDATAAVDVAALGRLREILARLNGAGYARGGAISRGGTIEGPAVRIELDPRECVLNRDLRCQRPGHDHGGDQ